MRMNFEVVMWVIPKQLINRTIVSFSWYFFFVRSFVEYFCRTINLTASNLYVILKALSSQFFYGKYLEFFFIWFDLISSFADYSQKIKTETQKHAQRNSFALSFALSVLELLSIIAATTAAYDVRENLTPDCASELFFCLRRNGETTKNKKAHTPNRELYRKRHEPSDMIGI